MVDNDATMGSQNEEVNQTQQPSFIMSCARMFLMMTALQFVMKNFAPNPPTANDNMPDVVSPIDQAQQFADLSKSGEDGNEYNDNKRSKNQRMKPLGVNPLNVNPLNMLAKSSEFYQAQPNKFSIKGPMHQCLWELGTTVDLNVFYVETNYNNATYTKPSKGLLQSMLDIISQGGEGNVVSKQTGNTKKRNDVILARWQERNLILGAREAAGANLRNSSVVIDVSKALVSNETQIIAHFFLHRIGNDRKKITLRDGSRGIFHQSFPVTQYKLKKKTREVTNLLGHKDNENDADDMLEEDDTIFGRASKDKDNDAILNYIKPSLSLQLISNLPASFPRNTIPTQMSKHMLFFDNFTTVTNNEVRKMPADIHSGSYYPIVYPSEFWMKTDSLIPINGTLKNITIALDFSVQPFWKWQMMSNMEEQWKKQEEAGGEEGSADMLRTLLTDTNPWLLGITFVVSLLHTVFDFLAFKNDISFFKGAKSMNGLSVRSMVVNAFFQVIIFFYLMDNETSYMVLMSNGVGLVIEFWKITKAVRFSFENGKLTWVETSTFSGSKTKEYDEIAMNHLLFVTMPLVAGYGIYSLVHMKHKGWYSWLLNTLVGFIYMFGFVTMTPQLFINYKLKSVAHLNWRTLTYKSISTFIDDLFAFVIKMPVMHRLACLRDDVIFFVVLYQRYIYRTDYTRVNEYGQCEKPTEDMIKASMSVPLVESSQNIMPEADARENGRVNVTRKRRGARDKASASE